MLLVLKYLFWNDVKTVKASFLSLPNTLDVAPVLSKEFLGFQATLTVDSL